MALRFYEKVVVVNAETFSTLVGQFGYITGISEEDGVTHGYAVTFLGETENVFLKPDEVQGTGQIADRSLFYDDAVPPVRVRVTDGNGDIVE